MEHHHIVLTVGDALLNDLGPGGGHRGLDLTGVGDGGVDDGVGGLLLGEDPAGEVLGAAADAPGLDEDGDGVIQPVVGPADGVVDREAVVIGAQARLGGVHMDGVHHLLGQLIHGGAVVQAAGGGDLQVVRVAHIAVLHAVEAELVSVRHHLGHEVAVGGVEVGQLRGFQGHVVPVHVEALVGGAGEEVRAVGIDAGDDQDVGVLQHLLPVGAGQVINQGQRALTGGGLVGVDLALNPDVQLAVGPDQLARLLQGGGGGQVGLGEDGDGHLEVIGGSAAQDVSIHIPAGGGLFGEEGHHLVLGGELMLGPLVGEEGGLELRKALEGAGGEVGQDLVRPEHDDRVRGLAVAVGHVRQIGAAGLIAVVGHPAGLEGQLLGARGGVGLGDVEELAHIVKSVPPDPAAVCAGFGQDQTAVLRGGEGLHLLQLGGGVAVAGGIALVDGDGDRLLGDVLGVDQVQLDARGGGGGACDKHTGRHGQSQQDRRELSCSFGSFHLLCLLSICGCSVRGVWFRRIFIPKHLFLTSETACGPTGGPGEGPAGWPVDRPSVSHYSTRR